MRQSTAIASAILLCSATSHAAEPTWSVRNAAEKLLDKHALRMPTDDWFLQGRDGSVLQYFKPTIVFTGGASSWSGEVRAAKWRVRQNGKWSQWNMPEGKASCFRFATMRVSAPATGGATATFSGDSGWFSPYKAPAQSWITQIR